MGNNILAICPGTREVGVALFINGQLTDWELCRFNKKWSPEKLTRIMQAITDWILTYRVTAVAVKIPNELPRSTAFIQLVGSLNVTFEANAIHTAYFTLKDLKKAFEVKENKEMLYEKVVALYPATSREYQKDICNAKPMYFKVFEAIAAGHVLSRTLKN